MITLLNSGKKVLRSPRVHFSKDNLEEIKANHYMVTYEYNGEAISATPFSFSVEHHQKSWIFRILLPFYVTIDIIKGLPYKNNGWHQWCKVFSISLAHSKWRSHSQLLLVKEVTTLDKTIFLWCFAHLIGIWTPCHFDWEQKLHGENP